MAKAVRAKTEFKLPRWLNHINYAKKVFNKTHIRDATFASARTRN